MPKLTGENLKVMSFKLCMKRLLVMIRSSLSLMTIYKYTKHYNYVQAYIHKYKHIYKYKNY
jgi:hypothetical protein